MLLGFKERFAPFVEAGSKTHTIRGERKIPPKVGEMCHCYVNPRQKTMRLLGRWACVKVDLHRAGQLVFKNAGDSPPWWFLVHARKYLEAQQAQAFRHLIGQAGSGKVTGIYDRQ